MPLSNLYYLDVYGTPEQTERKDMKQLRTRGQQHQPGRQCHKTLLFVTDVFEKGNVRVGQMVNFH